VFASDSNHTLEKVCVQQIPSR